jgi:hypothetical protein
MWNSASSTSVTIDGGIAIVPSAKDEGSAEHGGKDTPALWRHRGICTCMVIHRAWNYLVLPAFGKYAPVRVVRWHYASPWSVARTVQFLFHDQLQLLNAVPKGLQLSQSPNVWLLLILYMNLGLPHVHVRWSTLLKIFLCNGGRA